MSLVGKKRFDRLATPNQFPGLVESHVTCNANTETLRPES